jgi:replication factor A1
LILSRSKEEFNLSNIEELIKKISQKAGLSRAEIKKRIEDKQKELGGFVNDIAAAHIIAKDLNISLGRPELKKRAPLTIESLKKMEPGLSGVGITGIIIRVYHPIEFVREGTKGILAPILLHDGTDSIRTILWGTMAKRITDKQIERGSIIKIKQAYTKMGRNQELELHIGDRGLIELDSETENKNLPNPDDEILSLDALDEEMQEIDVKATVIRIGKLTTFSRSDGSEGRVSNLFLKGQRTTRRMVFWDARAESAFNFTRGDEIFIQAVSVKLDRDGKPELHATRTTYITKIGHKTLPSVEESQGELDRRDAIEKKLGDIKESDGMVTVIARKGPVSKTSKFTRSDGTAGSVQRATIFDDSSVTTLVLWNEIISSFEDLNDEPFQIKNLRVILSRYKTIELHTTTLTELNSLEASQIPEDPPLQNISDIKPQQGLVCVQGIIQTISEEREFNRSDGSTGRVASMSIRDTTGEIRVVAWDDNVEHLNEIREEEMKYIKIFFGGIRQRDTDAIEIHLSPQSHLRPSSRIPVALRGVEIVKEEQTTPQSIPEYQKLQLSELSETDDGVLIEVLGKVIRLFQQSPYYYACPQCRKKVIETDAGWICQEHQVVQPQIRFRLSGTLDDGTSTIRTVFFGLSGEILTGMGGADIQKLIDSGLTDDEIFPIVQQEVEGKTVLIQGRVQLQTQEVQGETIQRQELFANRVRFPSPKNIAEQLISEIQES